ncbi:MAG TPA: hypothetical protein VMR96_09960, partial [Solirubrobacterales bacterium]|nr:hypothetical protein [Solirubrobacterales bacterium]
MREARASVRPAAAAGPLGPRGGQVASLTTRPDSSPRLRGLVALGVLAALTSPAWASAFRAAAAPDQS